MLNPLTNDVVETPGGSLSLVGVNETDGNGIPNTSGNQVLFRPNYGFLGTATIGYTITDNLGGTSSSTITVSVVPNQVYSQLLPGGNFVISWSNSSFNLQSATNVSGPYLTIPGATSPYTNVTSAQAAGFFRLQYQPPAD